MAAASVCIKTGSVTTSLSTQAHPPLGRAVGHRCSWVPTVTIALPLEDRPEIHSALVNRQHLGPLDHKQGHSAIRLSILPVMVGLSTRSNTPQRRRSLHPGAYPPKKARRPPPRTEMISQDAPAQNANGKQGVPDQVPGCCRFRGKAMVDALAFEGSVCLMPKVTPEPIGSFTDHRHEHAHMREVPPLRTGFTWLEDPWASSPAPWADALVWMISLMSVTATLPHVERRSGRPTRRR